MRDVDWLSGLLVCLAAVVAAVVVIFVASWLFDWFVGDPD